MVIDKFRDDKFDIINIHKEDKDKLENKSDKKDLFFNNLKLFLLQL